MTAPGKKQNNSRDLWRGFGISSAPVISTKSGIVERVAETTMKECEVSKTRQELSEYTDLSPTFAQVGPYII